MARAKFKLGHMIEAGEDFGKITEIRLKETGIEYVTGDDKVIPEQDVTAVYRAVAPRQPKAPGEKKKKSKRSEERAA
jgi:hypothetical protein